MARTAVAPDGRVWSVRRLWLPRLRRRDGRGNGDGDDDGDGDSGDASWGDAFLTGLPDDLGGIVIAIAGVVAIGLFVFFVLPYFLFVLELLVLPILFAYRILFRKPWTVEAVSRTPPRELLRWQVVGLRESGEAVGEVAYSLERGETSPVPSSALSRSGRTLGDNRARRRRPRSRSSPSS